MTESRISCPLCAYGGNAYAKNLSKERVHHWTGRLVDNTVYSEPFDTRIKRRRRRQERDEGQIVRQLKSVYPLGGMTAQELEQRVDAGLLNMTKNPANMFILRELRE